MTEHIEDQIQFSDSDSIFPPLPIEEWEETKNTLHLFFQIVGKIRLTLPVRVARAVRTDPTIPLRGLR